MRKFETQIVREYEDALNKAYDTIGKRNGKILRIVRRITTKKLYQEITDYLKECGDFTLSLVRESKTAGKWESIDEFSNKVKFIQFHDFEDSYHGITSIPLKGKHFIKIDWSV